MQSHFPAPSAHRTMLEPRWLALLPLDNSPFSPVEQRNPYATFPNNAKIGNLRRAFRPFPVLLLKPDTSDTTREGKGKEPVRGGADRSECTEMLRGDIEHVRELQVSIRLCSLCLVRMRSIDGRGGFPRISIA